MSTPEDVAARPDWADMEAESIERANGPKADGYDPGELKTVIADALREAEQRGTASHRATIERLERERDHLSDTGTDKADSWDRLAAEARLRKTAEAEVIRLRIALCEIGWANRLTSEERAEIARAALSAPATREEPNGK